jgi:hypothetical protein
VLCLFASGGIDLAAPTGPNDYVYLGCVADQYERNQVDVNGGTPGLPSLLLHAGNNYMPVTTCASASKRAGKRFFGLQRSFCRAGTSLVSALRHSAKPGVCTALCAPDNICRGGSLGHAPATSLYVFKTGKGELQAAAAFG